MTKRDRQEFEGYLRNCTDEQVRGVWLKEILARRMDYAALAQLEAAKRRVILEK